MLEYLECQSTLDQCRFRKLLHYLIKVRFVLVTRHGTRNVRHAATRLLVIILCSCINPLPLFVSVN